MSRGFATLMTSIFLFIMLTVSLAFLDYIFSNKRQTDAAGNAVSVKHIAEAGIEKAAWMLNNDAGYTGETATSFGDGEFSVAVNNITGSEKEIESTGFIPSAANPKISRTTKVKVEIDSTIVSFNYGVQTGNGGFVMGNNSVINGNIYSNGTIVGANGAQINGDGTSAGSGGKIEKVTVTGTAN